MEQYDPWAFEDFSGYLAVDEVYDGPFCVLFIVDGKSQRRLAYDVLDHTPAHADIRTFFQGFKGKVIQRGLSVRGITTDGSQLYPEMIEEVFPGVPHQVCRFHVLKGITHDVLTAVSHIRQTIRKTMPPLGRGGTFTQDQKDRAAQRKSIRRDNQELLQNRFLLVQRSLTPEQKLWVDGKSLLYPEIGKLRSLMDQVYDLYDPAFFHHELAMTKLRLLRTRIPEFQDFGKLPSKLASSGLEKSLTYFKDRRIESTSNVVERANRRHQKMQKSVYHLKTHQSLRHRIALDLFRDRGLPRRRTTLATLHHLRRTCPIRQESMYPC